jgi:hypothetical protein
MVLIDPLLGQAGIPYERVGNEKFRANRIHAHCIVVLESLRVTPVRSLDVFPNLVAVHEPTAFLASGHPLTVLISAGPVALLCRILSFDNP